VKRKASLNVSTTAWLRWFGHLSSEGTQHQMRVMQWWMAREGWSSTLMRKDLHPLRHQLRLYIINSHHDYLVAGHPGWWKMTELIMCKFWKGWLLCGGLHERLWPLKLHKNFPVCPTGKLMPNQIPDHCWQVILVDLITELPPSRGYDAIMLVEDCLYKWAHCIQHIQTHSCWR